MARQANRKKPIIPKAYPIDLRERLVRAVEGGIVSTQSSTPVDDQLFKRAEMDGSVSVQAKHCVRPVENHWG
jgi:hypothetical protein